MKKKLLFVNGHLNIGGVERSLVDLLRHIDPRIYDVDLVLFEAIGDYAEEIPEEVNIIFYDLTKTYGPFMKCMINGIKSKDWFSIKLRLVFLLYTRINIKLLAFAKPLFKLNKGYDCAIAYRVGICTDFIGYVVKSAKKISWWHHGEYNISDSQAKRLKTVLSTVNKLVVVSDSCKNMLIERLPGFEEKIVVIPNIIDVDAIREKANESQACGISVTKQITLLTMGRLSPEKGMINCVHACKILIDKGYQIKWFILGDGEQRNEIEALIGSFGLEDNISLLGNMLNPYPYLKKSSIYVHPSSVESLSIAILEAMALNTPVVVAKSMGPLEYIRDRENGLLVDATPEGLHTGIVNLITDKNLYNQLKENKTGFFNQYSPEMVIEKVNDLIG